MAVQNWEDRVVGGEHRGKEERLRNRGDDQEGHLPRLRAHGTRATPGGLREKQQHSPQGELGFCWNKLGGRIAEKCKLGIWKTCSWLDCDFQGAWWKRSRNLGGGRRV